MIQGRSNGKQEHTPRQIRQCRYCKAKFEVDPRYGWKEFCKESHRKLYWKYGSLSIGKVAERVQRDVLKAVHAEVEPLRARVAELERLVKPEFVAIDEGTIRDAARRVPSGGAAA